MRTRPQPKAGASRSTFLPKGKTIAAVVGIAVAGLISGILVAQVASPSDTPPPVAAPTGSASAAPTSGAVDVTATQAIPAPDKALFPPNVPYATLIAGGSSETNGRVVQLPSLSVQIVDTRCDVTKIVEWSRPGGGKYCVVSVVLSVKNSQPVTISAYNQLIYGVPARKGAAGGYQGTFLLDQNKAPAETLTVEPGKQVNALLVFDVQDGFTASQLVPQER